MGEIRLSPSEIQPKGLSEIAPFGSGCGVPAGRLELPPLKGEVAKSPILPEGFPRKEQKIHLPPVDRPAENGYNEDARGAAGRRLTPWDYRSNRVIGVGRLLLFIIADL